MAIHANRGVIGVTAYATVTCIRIRLVRVRGISCMAGIDTGKDLIVSRVDMAITAARALVRNSERRMVENRPQPGGGHPGRMAGSASCRIRSSYVIRYRGPIVLRGREVGLVAAVAIRRRVTGGVVAA